METKLKQLVICLTVLVMAAMVVGCNGSNSGEGQASSAGSSSAQSATYTVTYMDAFTFELPNEYEEQASKKGDDSRLFAIVDSIGGRGGTKAVTVSYVDYESPQSVINYFDGIEDGLVLADTKLANVEHLTIDGYKAVVADGISTDSSQGALKYINLSDGSNRGYLILVFNYDLNTEEDLIESIRVL